MSDPDLTSRNPQDEERDFEAALRPTKLADFAGQPHARELLSIAIEAAKQRGEALDHVLLCGPPGLGKTTLAGIIAQELSVPIQQTAGPIPLQKKIRFERHFEWCPRTRSFSSMRFTVCCPISKRFSMPHFEDFRLDILNRHRPGHKNALAFFAAITVVGTTTKQGLLELLAAGTFWDRAAPQAYDEETLGGIVERSANLLGVKISANAAREIARRGRGTPRIANRLLRRVRDYAQVRADGHIDSGVAQAALDLLKVDRFGLDSVDQKIMLTVMVKYGGGPVGLSTIAASIDEQTDTIEEVYEPYLMQLGFLDRTPRGRIATDRAFDYFGVNRRTRFPWQQWFAESPVLSGVPWRRSGCIFSLGLQNMGERQENLELAIAALESEQIRVIARSSIYETEPQDVTDQPWFLNMVVQCETNCFPIQLLAVLRRIENGLGRVRTPTGRRGPRLIDIDILLFGQVSMKTPHLTIPHPRMLDRRFVLEPLLKMDASLRQPGTKEMLFDRLRKLSGQRVKKLDAATPR